MPFVLIFMGALFTAAAVNNTQGALAAQLRKDFTGPGNFSLWAVTVVGIGSLGYLKQIKPIVDSLLLLIFLVFVLANRGFFQQFNSALNGALTPQPGDVAGQSLPDAIKNSTIGAPASNQQEFTNPTAGQLSILSNLQAFANTGTNTLRGIVNRFMPASAANNAATYLPGLSAATGFGPDQPLDLKDPKVYGPIIDALSYGGSAHQYDATVYN